MHLVLVDGGGLPSDLVLLLLELALDALGIVHQIGDLLVLLLLLRQLNSIANLLLVVRLAGGRSVAEI